MSSCQRYTICCMIVNIICYSNIKFITLLRFINFTTHTHRKPHFLMELNWVTIHSFFHKNLIQLRSDIFNVFVGYCWFLYCNYVSPLLHWCGFDVYGFSVVLYGNARGWLIDGICFIIINIYDVVSKIIYIKILLKVIIIFRQ